MSQFLMTQLPDPTPKYAEHYPLLPEDPARAGDSWIDSRLAGSPTGVVYHTHTDGSNPVMLIHLRNGATSDPATRAHFSGKINATYTDTVVACGGQDQDEGRMAMRLWNRGDGPIVVSHRPLAPRVALVFSDPPKAVAEAQRVLAVVDLMYTPQFSSPVGPDFQMHWWQNIRPGTWRMWPLPWSGHEDRVGWLSLLTPFLLMPLIASVTALLTILVFQNQQKVSPPVPMSSSESTTGSGSGSSFLSQSSGGPSSGESFSRGPLELESYSDTPSTEQPSGGSSGPGSPSPEHKL